MKIAVFKETRQGENRVALTPQVCASLQKMGFEVWVEKDAGISAHFTNEMYELTGAAVKSSAEILTADIFVQINVPTVEQIQTIPDGKTWISSLYFRTNPEVIEAFSKKNISAVSLDAIPRISRAQSMDILSSQANLAGYRAVIEGAYHLDKIFPMLMTAAGTVTPSKVLIFGVGVAGLQAIATAKRLGAVVEATDVRPETKEQVQSLGAKFIEVKTDEKIDGVYAKEMSEEYKIKQQQLLEETIKTQDVVISTALIPGKKAPILITEKMVNSMKPNSIIIDLATVNGGNCELTKSDKIIVHNNVTIIGYENYPSRIALDASKFFAKNILNFVELLIDKDKNLILINRDDEIIKSTLICSNKTITNENFLN